MGNNVSIPSTDFWTFYYNPNRWSKSEFESFLEGKNSESWGKVSKKRQLSGDFELGQLGVIKVVENNKNIISGIHGIVKITRMPYEVKNNLGEIQTAVDIEVIHKCLIDKHLIKTNLMLSQDKYLVKGVQGGPIMPLIPEVFEEICSISGFSSNLI